MIEEILNFAKKFFNQKGDSATLILSISIKQYRLKLSEKDSTVNPFKDLDSTCSSSISSKLETISKSIKTETSLAIPRALRQSPLFGVIPKSKI